MVLHSSFEDAAAAVRRGSADAVVVANAYAHINEIYMDPELALVGAFIMSTPEYGLAAPPCAPVPLCVRVATHPAPERLIGDLLPASFLVREVRAAASTSEAARMVVQSEVDLALTNETSRGEYGLQFMSPTRPIRMLWSLFMRPPAEVGR